MNKPSRRKLHRKLRERSEEDGTFQEGDYDDSEDSGEEIKGDHELDDQ